MAFPSTLSTFVRPNATDRLNSPSHSALHNTVSSALGQVEAVIGVDGDNSVLGTIIGDLRSPGSGGGGHVQSANKGGTGQTTFNKGDLLIAQSSSVISKLAVGANNLALIADSTQSLGIKWGTLPAPTIRYYTSSAVAIWTKPSNLAYVVVEVQGAGGGGGGSNAGVGAGGGGAGGFGRSLFSASSVATAVSIIAGSFGVGKTGGAGAGTQGGHSFWGTSIVAGGGAGAAGAASHVGGTGGSVFGADFKISGRTGNSGFVSDAAASLGGGGGSAFYGPGSEDNAVGNGAAALQGYGGGGGGGAGGADGGNGNNGIVIVYEY